MRILIVLKCDSCRRAEPERSVDPREVGRFFRRVVEELPALFYALEWPKIREFCLCCLSGRTLDVRHLDPREGGDL